MKSLQQVFATVVFVLLCVGLPVGAQDFDPTIQDTILICVEPEDMVVGNPYLLIFRNTPSLGILIPDNSNVTVYSASTLSAALYGITPDTITGGYRLDNHLATVEAVNNVSSSRACGSIEDYITPELRATIPLPVSANHVVLMQRDSNLLDNPDLLGVFAFQFRPTDSDAFRARFQVIQLDGGSIDLNLPFYTEEVPFTLIANKNVSVRRSFADAPDDFSSRSFANDRSDFVRELALDDLNLFEIMTSDLVRIYPLQGLQGEYAPGGYLRLEMSPAQSLREPQFTPGDTVRSIDDDTIDYVAFADPALSGFLRSNELPQVLRIETTGEFAGQLVVRYADGSEIVVDAWLVDVCRNDC